MGDLQDHTWLKQILKKRLRRYIRKRDLLQEAADELYKEILHELLKENTLRIALENFTMEIDLNGTITIEAWNTSFSTRVTHSEFNTGSLTVEIKLPKEDTEKLINIFLNARLQQR